jgi:threonine dehydratase
MKTNIRKEVLEAEGRIRPYIRKTPVEPSPILSQAGRCTVHLKLENLQITGSFKLRGAANKLLSLSREEKARGVITASTGNHGHAFAHVIEKLGGQGTIYLPRNADRAKIDSLRLYDVDLQFYGDDCVQTETQAKRAAQDQNLIYISPYNDMKIIGGQGTVGLELEQQIETIDAVLVPIGGGGLIAGIAGYLKSTYTGIEIIGCQPENSAVMFESIKAGRIVQMESKPTISEGTAGGIEQGAITFSICQRYVDDIICVSEAEIKEALLMIMENHSLLIEGAAALPVAVFIKKKARFKDKNVALILSGSRISLERLKGILCERGEACD